MVQNSYRPNRHSNPSSQAKSHRHNGKFKFIRKKNREVKEMLKELP